jgi:hypothetical protein
MKGQRIISVQAEVLGDLFTTGTEHHFATVEGLPSDARAIRFFSPQSFGRVGDETIIAIVFESDQWPPINKGDVIPELTPEFRTLHCKFESRSENPA